jgi:putative GTP pyrophosphokinase
MSPSLESTFVPMRKEDFRKEYEQHASKYSELRVSLQDALKRVLKMEGKLILDVTSRVKEMDSAYDKIVKYKIDNPFQNIYDWCGLRIICYYTDDVDEIGKILEKEFDIIERRDKRESPDSNQFGYRSLHYLLKIKNSWSETPTYRGLEGIIVEVQIRTILMHAWAEIEHKLQYKTLIEVPIKLKRQLSRLSAKFEEADEQFEAIRNGVAEYEKELQARADTIDAFKNEELNVNVLSAFISLAILNEQPHPNTYYGKSYIQWYIDAGLTMNDIVEAYKLGKDFLKVAEDNTAKIIGSPGISYSADYALEVIMEIASDKYRAYAIENNITSGGWIKSDPAIFETRKALEEATSKS